MFLDKSQNYSMYQKLGFKFHVGSFDFYSLII